LLHFRLILPALASRHQGAESGLNKKSVQRLDVIPQGRAAIVQTGIASAKSFNAFNIHAT
jgi:hypothetical protein